tara:strand:- start:268 stop:1290 length:1023 start_codon:yes stop_codon:yes gene_type:complete
MSRARDRADGVLHNRTHEDTEGGRESIVTFKGEQSGGEISTLAQIQASHDGTADDQKGDLILKTNDGSDNAAPTEAVRIDSSQNLLVGKTSNAFATTGVALNPDGSNNMTRDGDPPLSLNRLTSNGNILNIFKDGTSVGSIGNDGNDFYVTGSAANIAGIYLANSKALPMKSGSIADGQSDLGNSSYRWKDLYLSGGAYIGGTAAANKLEDYEEGTWTPSFTGGVTSGSHSQQHGDYTKVGRVVHFELDITATTNPSGSLVRIGGLPFSSSNVGNLFGFGVINYQVNFLNASDTGSVTIHVGGNSDSVAFFKNDGNSFLGTDANNCNGRLIISGRYFTDA